MPTVKRPFKEWFDERLPLLMERIKHPVGAFLRSKSGEITACRYRVNADAGDMRPENCCFVGAMLTADEYDEVGEEFLSGYTLALFNPSDRPLANNVLQQIQSLHDGTRKFDASTTNYWQKSLHAITEKL